MLTGVCPFRKKYSRDRAWLGKATLVAQTAEGQGLSSAPRGLSGALRVQGADVPRVFAINSFISDVK